MAEVTPSNPKGSGGAAAGGAILGGVIGLLVAVVLSIVATTTYAFWDGSAPRTAGACGRGIVAGIVLLAVAAALGWIAWHMHFRNTSRTFGAGFLRGLATVVAVFLLVPWPCSYTWAAFMSFGTCGR